MASSPPYDDPKSYLSRKSSKITKPSLSRTSKRTASSQEHSPTLDGRHKRVWKACERCRMKKTKCDGESPCKRCKDDGLICQAGTRRKTEYKQAPKGYAEVLETSQVALTHTVQKLYKMLRAGEQWDYGEPDLNERGEPVIHDIVRRIGAIRHPSDEPQCFPETYGQCDELSTQMREAEKVSGLDSDRKHSHDTSASSPPTLKREDRASSSDSDSSLPEQQYFASPWGQPKSMSTSHQPPAFTNSMPTSRTSYDSSNPPSIDTPSPIFNTFTPDSPVMFDGGDSPFNAWAMDTGDFLSQNHPLAEMSQYLEMRKPTMPNVQQFAQYSRQGFTSEMVRGMQLSTNASFQGDGTIRPSQMNASPTNFDPMDFMPGNGFN